MGNNLNEAIFLTAMLSGIVPVVAGVVITRLNWRPDVPPYSLRTRSLDVLMHPERYALPKVLFLIRTLNAVGLLLLAIAVLAIARQVAMQFLS